MQHLRVSGHFMWARGHVITISDYTLNEKQNQLHSGSYTGMLKCTLSVAVHAYHRSGRSQLTIIIQNADSMVTEEVIWVICIIIAAKIFSCKNIYRVTLI